ncbi:MAG: nicotinate (nicotinamide) nucleotide adenylyltransferase [Acidobacteriota bacterium]|nr:nicotinate (nicotinamide) nucleotide adenylyltransferase [Acidobacteriota bacterium]
MADHEPIAGRRVAFFGGSFDPPHTGHMAIARAARKALALDTILFAPVGAQPLKPLGSTASFEDRMAMTELATSDEPGMLVSRVDAPRPDGAPNYTIDTLRSVRTCIAADAELFCLIGADSMHGFRHWYRAAEIPFAASLIVASRPGENLENLVSLLPGGIRLETGEVTSQGSGDSALFTYTIVNPSGATASCYVLPGLHVDVSASQIRASKLNGTGSESFLLPKVAEYISEHHLYAEKE